MRSGPPQRRPSRRSTTSRHPRRSPSAPPTPASDHAVARIVPFWKDVWNSSRLSWWLQAGQYTYTPDRRPLLGPTEIGGLAVNTGYSGHGIMGSIGGSRRAVDAITGRLKPANNPFRPDRPMHTRSFDIL